MLGLDEFINSYGVAATVGAALSLAAGGFAKGVVGFALPLIGLSLMASILPFEVALALLILPTFGSNIVQSLRNGPAAALASLKRFWRLNLVLVITIALAAQLVVALPDTFFYGVLGFTITLFGISQIVGWRPSPPRSHIRPIEICVGLVAGFFGGISGVWGPPIIMYLIALEVPKVEMVRTQSLAFMLGSIVLTSAHLKSGVLNAVTFPASAWMIVPTMLAMLAGYRVQDMLDQERFRKATLLVLVVSGLNLLRRAFIA